VEFQVRSLYDRTRYMYVYDISYHGTIVQYHGTIMVLYVPIIGPAGTNFVQYHGVSL